MFARPIYFKLKRKKGKRFVSNRWISWVGYITWHDTVWKLWERRVAGLEIVHSFLCYFKRWSGHCSLWNALTHCVEICKLMVLLKGSGNSLKLIRIVNTFGPSRHNKLITCILAGTTLSVLPLLGVEASVNISNLHVYYWPARPGDNFTSNN